MAALAERNAFVVHEVSSTIFSSTDALILSTFCSLKVTSVYTVYNMVFYSLSSLIASVNNGQALEYWDNRKFFTFAAFNLFPAAVNSDSFRYILTLAQALNGTDGDEVLSALPYPYDPGKEKTDD
jgi:hypothetical protein